MLQQLRRLNPDRAEDLVWDGRDLDQLVPAAIHEVTETFNKQSFDETLEPLRALCVRDAATGIEYMRLREPGDTKAMAVVHFNPFANGLSDNMLLRAAYCDAVLRAGGLTDAHGRHLPFVTMAAPSGNQKLHLKRHHHRRMARGQFDSLAAHYLDVVQRLGYQRIAIIGYSQGASLAVAAAAVAGQLGLEVTHLAIGEPANVTDRSRAQLIRHFFGSNKHLPKAVHAVNMPALHEAHRQDMASNITLKLLRKIRLNYTLLSGLSRASFETELESVLAQGIPVTLSYGDLTTISPPTELKATVARIRADPDYQHHSLHVVEVAGGHHAWADSLNLLATFYAYGLLR